MKKISFRFILLSMILFSCEAKYPLKLGKNYKLNYDGNSNLYILNSHNTVMIGSHITGYNFDSVFIIAEQKPRELILKDAYTNPEMPLRKSNKIFKESNLRYYWIINKTTDSIYGPLKKDEYFEKRKELGISTRLQRIVE